MILKCGIVGLPNVGKSTLFNALTASTAAEAANYPFCTIEPNTGIVAVPDERLQKLANIVGSAKILPAYIEFVDIAGLVKGASQGAGLGNKFLSHIREVDAILHVLRCFKDTNITHVHDTVDPLYDAEIIETELILADLESVKRRLVTAEKKHKISKAESELELLRSVHDWLDQGRAVRHLPDITNEQLRELQLLTTKPVLYICNVLEDEASTGNAMTDVVANKIRQENADYVIISSKIEAEIASLPTITEKEEFLRSLGLPISGLHKVIKAAYELLSLQSFFTVGPKETHAWTFKIGTNAAKAAGIIHTDFEKGFIRAEVIGYDDYIICEGEKKAKETGKVRLEGEDYKVQNGDVIYFRFNT